MDKNIKLSLKESETIFCENAVAFIADKLNEGDEFTLDFEETGEITLCETSADTLYKDENGVLYVFAGSERYRVDWLPVRYIAALLDAFRYTLDKIAEEN